MGIPLTTHRLQLLGQLAVLKHHVVIALAWGARVGRHERVPVVVLGVEHEKHCQDSCERVQGRHGALHRRHHPIDDELAVRVASIPGFLERLLRHK